ncbi:MAG: OmpH family outer membrane protein [Pyrinomonadaceae bacterium]
MKKVTTLVVSFVFAAMFAVSAFGQAGAPAVTKIGWINTAAFGGDDKGLNGVTKYVNAMKTLDTEFKPRITELQTLDGKIKAIAEELQKMQSNTAVPINQQTVAAKQEEGQRLQRELEFKQKDAEAAVQARRNTLLAPIMTDLDKAIQEFSKQKGYTVVFDIAALANANAILVLDPSADITKEFIAYYNTRPATTAAVTTPK